MAEVLRQKFLRFVISPQNIENKKISCKFKNVCPFAIHCQTVIRGYEKNLAIGAYFLIFQSTPCAIEMMEIGHCKRYIAIYYIDISIIADFKKKKVWRDLELLKTQI